MNPKTTRVKWVRNGFIIDFSAYIFCMASPSDIITRFQNFKICQTLIFQSICGRYSRPSSTDNYNIQYILFVVSKISRLDVLIGTIIGLSIVVGITIINVRSIQFSNKISDIEITKMISKIK